LTDKQVDDRRLILSQRDQAVSQRRNNILITEAQRAQQEANAYAARMEAARGAAQA
jgi:hypothetical protein